MCYYSESMRHVYLHLRNAVFTERYVEFQRCCCLVFCTTDVKEIYEVAR